MKYRCGSKMPPPISFSDSWKDGEEGRAQAPGSDIPGVQRRLRFSPRHVLGQPAPRTGLWSWGVPGRKVSGSEALPLGRKSNDWKSRAQETGIHSLPGKRRRWESSAT